MQRTPSRLNFDASWSCRSEPGIQVKLQGVDTQRGAIDRVRTQVPHAHPNTVREAVVGNDIVARGIGAAEVEIRVRIGVDHGIALHIAIADHAAPRTGREDRRMAEAELRLIAFRAGRNVRADVGRYPGCTIS